MGLSGLSCECVFCQKMPAKPCETDEGIASDCDSPNSVQGLMRQAQARETKVLELQAEVAKVQRIDDTFKV